MSLHHKLTVDHFKLDPASKMRNHLAEDVLDRNMMALMKVQQINTFLVTDFSVNGLMIRAGNSYIN